MKKNNKKVLETTGKVEDFQPTTLEQLWGFDSMSRYGTTKEEEYNAQLTQMTRADLETHAKKQGVVLLETNARLIDACLKEFRVYVSSLQKPKQPKNQSKEDASPEVQRILNEGR